MSKDNFAGLQQPVAMSEDGNMATNWREWKSAFDYYLIASGKESASSREKCALFLHVIGKFGREILEELDLEEESRTNHETLVTKFKRHCDPSRNINYERHVFFDTCQREDSFDKFLSALKVRSKSCEFGQLRSSLIVTQIIRGLKDSSMRERMLAKTKLDLESAVTWCRAVETASKQAEACAEVGKASTSVAASAAAEPAVEAIRSGAARPPRGAFRRPDVTGVARHQHKSQQRIHGASQANMCGFCGRKHGGNHQCPARNVKCHRCNRIGHYLRVCRAKFVGELEQLQYDEDCAELCESLLGSLSIDEIGNNGNAWFEDVKIDNKIVNFKVDSGAEVTVMSLRDFRMSGYDESILKKCKSAIREVSKNKLPVIGYFEASLSLNAMVTRQKVYVLNLNCNNLLGYKACLELKLIVPRNVSEIQKLNIDESVFEGIGCLPKLYKIDIDTSVPPVVNASRKVPMKIRPRLKLELENMEKLGIITKIDSPTDWVSNIVIVEKPDKLRICLDPYHLNKAVRRSHFQLPTLDEITSHLTGAKVFSKLDARNGFWMLMLDDESSRLCTFSTPFGRYRWLRMPFGINCAPEIFHHEMYKIFSMPGVEVFADDVLVWGHDSQEHDMRLREVLRRAAEYGVKFNREKCVFSAAAVDFLGHTLNGSGIRPTTNRVSAITSIEKPKDKKELERFLGMTNYVSRFIPNYATVAAPLRSLLKKDVVFEWLRVHDESFSQLKEAISCAPVLRYYSPQEPVTLSVDASTHGLGACLLQGGQPVAYAARTLTPTEKRWAQIEKEMLAIYFGCVRFHYYIYGHSQVTIESDHKPLETIVRKPLNETPPRLQRMLLKLQAHRLNVVYKPGKYMYVADALSRAATERGVRSDSCEEQVTVHVNAVYENMDASDERLLRIRTETIKDKVLSAVIDYYREGWPNEKKLISSSVSPFWTFRHELYEINGLLFHNKRVVIPSTLRKDMLDRIHEGHLGIEKCRRRAREAVWWPGMSAQIEECVQRCETCQRHRAAPPREPLVPHPVPERAWDTLAADIFELNKRQYLLVVDYYSKFVEVVYLPNMTSEMVIGKMKGMFSRFGIPRKLVTDNAKQFKSREFDLFVNTWEFQHVTSSPLYPRSNGFAERNVQTVKRLFKKATEDKTDWQLALLNFRNTPVSGEEYSPAQLLMGRPLNTRLPVAPQALLPTNVHAGRVKKIRQKKINQMKGHYDRGTKLLPALRSGEQVRVKDGKVWNKARVIKEADGERSYWVRAENGGTYRRNRSHILKQNVKGATVGRHSLAQSNYSQGYPSSDDESVLESPRGSVSTGVQGRELTATESVPVAPNRTTRSGRIVKAPKRFVCT